MDVMKNQTEESFDTIIGGRNVCLEFTRVTVFVHDAHYGADADGNRGWPMDFIDEDYAEDVLVEFDGEGSGAILDVQTEVDSAIEKYLESHEPTMPEEPERDWDVVNDEKRDEI